MLLDANYLLRWFLNDVDNQSTVVDTLLRESGPESLVVDRVSIAEVTYVLRGKGYNHTQIYMLFEELLAYPSMAEMSTTDSLALSIFKDTNFDFEDCWLASYTRINKTVLATFDKKLIKYLQIQR